MKISKTYRMGNLKKRDRDNLVEAIEKLGFSSVDYKIVHFSGSQELKICNKELHWLLKSIGKLERVKSVGNR